MKKALAIFLSAFMLALLVVSPAAFAEQDHNAVTIEALAPATASPGSTITVTASITSNEGFSNAVLKPILGGLAFGEWKEGDVTDMEYTIKSKDEETGNQTAPTENVVLDYDGDYTGTTTNLVSFTATIPADAAENTEYTVGFGIVVDPSTADEGDVTFTFATATVTVKNGLPGDLNHDDIVDEDDAIYLLMYTVFPEDFPVDSPEACDYNQDGIVDEDDAIYLLMYTVFPEDFPI